MTQPNAIQQLLVEKAHEVSKMMATAMAPFAVALDAQPNGIDAVVLAAVLQAFAEHISGAMQPELKPAVDSIRQETLKALRAS